MKKNKIAIFMAYFIAISAIILECTSGRPLPTILLNSLFYIVLLRVSISDIRTMTIPDGCHIAILLLGFCSLFLNSSEWLLHLTGFFCISIPMLFLALFTGGFGGGDIKLCASCGFYLGAPLVLFGSIAGTVFAAFITIPLLLFRLLGKKDSICFGPFLSLGYVCAALYGSMIIESYLILFR